MKVWMAAVLAVIGIVGLVLSLLKLRGGARVALAIISGLVALFGVLYVLAAIVLVSAVD